MINFSKDALFVIETLEKSGFEAFLVGGAVRDAIMNKTPTDYDITTNATPEKVISLFERTIPTGIKHGTVTVIINSLPIEVTTYRTESGYSDSRHPESVKFVKNLQEDLMRRDFTTNALAFNEKTGVVDYFGGVSDIENKILRTVGKAEERFQEDALRILRLFRFSSTLQFSIEENTFWAALSLSKSLEKISSERIATELFKALCGKNAEILNPLIKSGGLEFLGIENEVDFSLFQNKNISDKLKIFMFLYLSKCDIQKTLTLLKTSNILKNYCLNLEKITALSPKNSKTDIKYLLSEFSEEEICDYFEMQNTDNIESILNQIHNENEPYKISHLALSGDDLKALGYSGKEIGEILSYLLNNVIKHPENNEKQKLIEIIKLY